MGPMESPKEKVRAEAIDEIDRLIEANRLRCLWFLRPDYHPSTDHERLRALAYIERYGDRDAYRRATELTRWLSRHSSGPSAVS